MLLRARGVDVNAYDKAAGKPDADAVGTKSAKSDTAKSKKDAKLKGTGVDEGSSSKAEALASEGEGDEMPSFWIEVGARAWATCCVGCSLCAQCECLTPV